MYLVMYYCIDIRTRASVIVTNMFCVTRSYIYALKKLTAFLDILGVFFNYNTHYNYKLWSTIVR